MTAIAHQPHPVTRALAGVRDQLTRRGEVPVWSMDAAETTATIAQLNAATPSSPSSRLASLCHADRIELPATLRPPRPRTGTPHATRTTRCRAPGDRGSPRVSRTTTSTRTALAEGRIHVDQAEAILNALTDLPTGLDPELLDQAERHLLEQAEVHDAKALKDLGRRILEVVDPEAADAHEAALLEREERDAQAATRLVIWDDGHGKTHGRFTVDSLPAPCSRRPCSHSPPPSTRPPRTRSANAAPPPSGSATPSSNSSSATRPSASPRPAASTPPSWS